MGYFGIKVSRIHSLARNLPAPWHRLAEGATGERAPRRGLLVSDPLPPAETMTRPATPAEIEARGIESEVKKARERFFWPASKLEDWRRERLRALLRFAKSESPWYRRTLSHVDPETFTEEDLGAIPPLDKVTLMSNWDEIVTHPDLSLRRVESHIAKMSEDPDLLYLQDRFHVLSTSGSSGTRGVYVYDRDEWIQRSASSRRLPLLDRELRPISFPSDKILLAHVVITHAVYGIYATPKTYTPPPLENLYIPVTLPMEEICSRLNAQRVDALIGIPSTLHKLCLEAGAGRLSIDPTIVYSTAEPLYGPIRRLIEKTWPKTCLFNALASAEGVYARNCRADSQEMHLNDDMFIIEPVDDEDRTVDRGERPDKLYVTNLSNYTLPLIRYESPDQLVFLDRACECGSNFQLIAEPKGRPEFNFTYPGGLYVHHLVFVTPLLLQENIQEYQVCQTENGALIKVVTLGEIDRPRLVRAVEEGLAGLGMSDPVVEVEEVQRFDYPPSGKLRRFVELA